MKKYYESRRPKTSMKYFGLLKDNAPAKKTRILTWYLETEKVSFLPDSRFLQIQPRAISFCSPNLNSPLWKNDTHHERPLGLQFIRVNKYIQAKGEFFEGQRPIKGSKINKWGKKKANCKCHYIWNTFCTQMDESVGS